MTKVVLALNGGSSSLKYALFRGEETQLRGSIERLGSGDRAAAVGAVFSELERRGLGAPDAVGHRLVHGGPLHALPVRIDDSVRASLDAAIPFAPLHLPSELRTVDAVREHFGDLPQVACFDTGFHRTMPEVAQRFALPEALFTAGVRRYGFHGLSYEYVVSELGSKRLGRAILAHLGSGASLAAVREGQSVDTTMAFTPTAGLVMGTRSGDLDPGVLIYLLSHQGYDAARLEHLVNHESGLLGVSQTTGDVKDLLARREYDERAVLAIDLFCHSIQKGIGAMAAALGGVDSLVFTGGVGAHSSAIRRQVCEKVAFLGVHLDDQRNGAHAAVISGSGSACTVHVIETDEERVIARSTRRVLNFADL